MLYTVIRSHLSEGIYGISADAYLVDGKSSGNRAECPGFWSKGRVVRFGGTTAINVTIVPRPFDAPHKKPETRTEGTGLHRLIIPVKDLI